MVKKMLINASHPEECRVAVVADGVLEDLDVQINTREATLGNIYKGVVTRIEPSLQAVFVDYGAGRNGFLSINDVHPSYFPESFEAGRRRPRIQDVFKKDGHVIVQVNKEERYTKGASLTTNISLAGRYLVLMPGTDLCGVSRKIEDEKERKKLKDILKQLTPPENMGFIIRTAGMGRTKTELSRDLNYLLKLWQSIEKNVASMSAPALLYKELDMVIRSIREHFSPDISEILVDDKEFHRKAREFFRQVMPKYENLVKLSQDKRPLFNKYQLEEQIEHVYEKRIKLKSGGYIIIEPTEALVSVDVNSGSSTKEKGVEETAFRVNMEAAPEVVRQLKLRDLGGIVVVDFIDMVHKKHKQEVERVFKAALKSDRAKTKVLRISALGLLELSRQRLKSSLGTGEYLECPLCDGHGKVRSTETTALSVFRKVKSQLIKGGVCEVRATVPAKVAEYLLNNMRGKLGELETQYGSRISILSRQVFPDKEIIVEAIREEILETRPLELAEPLAPALPLPFQVSAELSGTVETIVEEEAAEAEPPKAKRPSRRRRRSKKRVTSDVEEAEAATEAETPLQEGPSSEDLGPSRFEEILLQAVIGRPLWTGASPAALKTSEPTGSSQEGAELSEQSAVKEQQAPELEAEATDEPPAAAAPDRDEALAAESEASEAAAKKEPRKRKNSLQNYLPFS